MIFLNHLIGRSIALAEDFDSEIITTEILFLAAMEHKDFSSLFARGKIPKIIKIFESEISTNNFFPLSKSRTSTKPIFSSVIIDSLPSIRTSMDLLSFFHDLPLRNGYLDLPPNYFFLVSEIVKTEASSDALTNMISASPPQSMDTRSQADVFPIVPDLSRNLIGRDNEVDLSIARLFMAKERSTILHIPKGSGRSFILGHIIRSVDASFFEISPLPFRDIDYGAKRINQALLNNDIPNPVIYINLDNYSWLTPDDVSNLVQRIDQKILFVASTSKQLFHPICDIFFTPPTIDETSEILKGELNNIGSDSISFDKDLLNHIKHISEISPIKDNLPSNVITFLDWASIVINKKNITLSDIDDFSKKYFKISSTNGGVSGLEGRLKKVIFGQDESIESISRKIRLSSSGLCDPNKPKATFLLSGPTGTGKTETAKTIAESLGVELFRFDMAEYSEAHTISRLVGSPAGYVGYGGLCGLEPASNKPCVILVDEFEKAHESVQNLFLRILDDGVATSASNKTMLFKKAIVIMTTNSGAKEMGKRPIGFSSSGSKSSHNILSSYFSPEILGRFNSILYFNAIGSSTVKKIVVKELKNAKLALSENGITFRYSPAVVSLILENIKNNTLGTRYIKNYIEGNILGLMVDDHISGGEDESKYSISVASGKFVLTRE